MLGVTQVIEGKTLKEVFSKLTILEDELRLGHKDKAFVYHVIYTLFRRRGEIEFTLNKYLNRPLPKRPIEVKAALMIGAVQIMFTRVPSYAAVNSSVLLFRGKSYKWRALGNALLRRLSNEYKENNNLYIHNTPKWLLTKWKKHYGEKKALAIAKSNLEEPLLDIVVKKDINLWSKKFNGQILGKSSIRVSNRGRIENLEGYKRGDWWIQDLSAQIPCSLMGNLRNKDVIDLCAAPGGKTAQMVRAGANVTAIEISKTRAEILKKKFKKIRLFD